MTSPPKIIVGFPIFNGEQHLKQALLSLLNQDYKNIEFILCDNASEDQTSEICQHFAATDPRIKYIRNEKNIGGLANFVKVLELADGDYFMWASHDDYWDQQYISKCISKLMVSENLVLVGARTSIINKYTGEKIATDKGISTVGQSAYNRYIAYRKFLYSGENYGGLFFGIYNTKLLKQSLPFKNIIGCDHLVLVNMSYLGEFHTIPEELFFKRTGGSSLSYKNIGKVLQLKNPFYLYFPMFVREMYFIQSIIDRCQIGVFHKVALIINTLLLFVYSECISKPLRDLKFAFWKHVVRPILVNTGLRK